MKPKIILTAGPSITDKEVDYVLDAVKNGWNSKRHQSAERPQSHGSGHRLCARP
jgi:hypothetical protein